MSLRSPSNTRFAWPLTYRGPSGVAPTPQAPWTQRRDAWLALIAPTELGGKGRRFELGRQGSRVQAEERELRRLVEEGLLVPAGKPRTRGGQRRRFLELTEAGLMAWEKIRPKAERVPEPYAKRRSDPIFGQKP